VGREAADVTELPLRQWAEFWFNPERNERLDLLHGRELYMKRSAIRVQRQARAAVALHPKLPAALGTVRDGADERLVVSSSGVQELLARWASTKTSRNSRLA
jgi:hypothetical protein